MRFTTPTVFRVWLRWWLSFSIRGPTKRSAPKIAADLGQIGAEFDATASSEYTLVTASTLSNKADTLVKNVCELVTEPTFSEAEVERVRKQTLASIQHLQDNPAVFTDQAFKSYLFDSHPYAHSVPGTLKAVASIKKKHIIQHYLRYYRPNNAILAVVGKYTPELAAQIEKDFGSWQARDVPPTKFGAAPVIKDAKFFSSTSRDWCKLKSALATSASRASRRTSWPFAWRTPFSAALSPAGSTIACAATWG